MTPPPAPQVLPQGSPGATGWVLAAGLSVSVHVLIAAAGVLAMAHAPAPSPSGQTEIVVQSIPLVTGGGAQNAPRLGAMAPDARQSASRDATRLAPEDSGAGPMDEGAGRRLVPQSLGAESPGARFREAQSLDARTLGPQPATPPAESATRQAALAPVAPQRLQAEAQRPIARLVAPSEPARAQRLGADQGAQPLRALPAQGAARSSAAPDPSGPEPAPMQSALAALPPPAVAPDLPTGDLSTPGLPARAMPAMPGATASAPREDSLLLALRARPERSMGDRQAAPRLPDPVSDAVQPLAPEDPLAQDLAQYRQVVSYLRNLPDIACFAALPALGEDGILRLDVFGPATTGLDAFRANLEAATGLIPAMTLRPIAEGQCETLDFVRASAGYPATGLYFDLKSRVIDSGSQLAGRMAGQQADLDALHLLLIDAAGRIQILDRFIGPDGRFAIPMELQGGDVQTWQLLMGIAAPRPFDLLGRLDRPQAAGPLFDALQAHADRTGTQPSIALVAFALNG